MIAAGAQSDAADAMLVALVVAALRRQTLSTRPMTTRSFVARPAGARR